MQNFSQKPGFFALTLPARVKNPVSISISLEEMQNFAQKPGFFAEVTILNLKS